MSVVAQFSYLAFLLLIASTQGYKVNITYFGNCDGIHNVEVNLTSAQYDYNDDGLCDTIHGKYYVHKFDPNVEYDLWMTIFQCAPTVMNKCSDNARKYTVITTCDELHANDTGPWTMLTKAMRGSRCAEDLGEFELQSAKLLPAYLENYLVVDPVLTRHRLQMIFHKIGENRISDHPRGCVDIQFDVII